MTITTPPTPTIDAERLAGFEHTLRTMVRDRVPPLSNDEASAARHRAHAESLDAAIARIERGTYGSCTWCGDPIPIERLEVVPAAAGCRACTAQRR